MGSNFTNLMGAYRSGLWQLIQTSALGGGTESLAFNSNNTSGHLLILTATGTSDLLVATDTQGNDWIRITNVTSGGLHISMFYAKNCKAGANTVTCTGSYSMHLAEWDGADTYNTLESFAISTLGSTLAGSNNAITNNLSTLTNNCLIVAGCVCSAGPLTVGTNLPWTTPNGDVNGLTEYLIQSRSSDIIAAITDGTSSDLYGMIVTAFRHL